MDPVRATVAAALALALGFPALAADGGVPAAGPGAFDVVVAEARGVLSLPYQREANLVIRRKLLDCVKREEANAVCWKLLATAYAKGSKEDKDDEARAVAAFRRWLELVPTKPALDELKVSPMGDWGHP